MTTRVKKTATKKPARKVAKKPTKTTTKRAPAKKLTKAAVVRDEDVDDALTKLEDALRELDLDPVVADVAVDGLYCLERTPNGKKAIASAGKRMRRRW